MEDLSGQTLKGYKLLDRIGSGGFGVVYRAHQPTVGREVALKIILPAVASQPDFIRRFEIEAQLIARLEHLHVVPLYDFWRDPTGAYLVMRWLRAGSLALALQDGPLALSGAVTLVDQVASGLAAAHNHRIVHRDLKPSNILMDDEGNAYLSDFGIALDLARPGPGGHRKEVQDGSLGYLSPEQARGQEITHKTDLYSLGVTLYEALTGRHPFPELSSVERLYKHIDEPLPPIDSLDPAVAEGINQVIQKATAKDPDRRYADALAMAAAFRDAARVGENGAGQVLEESLTQRERQILAYIVDGQTNKQIARALFVELPTVKWHITHLYRKMGVRSRMQAIVRARDLQLIPGEPEEFEDPAAAEGSVATSTGISLARPINPYKGLRPFEAADSRDFFGREALVEQLLDRLREPGQTSRFLAVLGPSGSGKSSLLSAGLVPAIWSGALPGSERWFVVEMAPGSRPLDELEVALTRIAAEQAGNLHAHLHRDAGGLLRAAGLILPNDNSELFLIIDQFEELFILTEDETVRRHFLDLLTEASADPRSRVRVLVAMRADFYDRPLQVPGFGQLLRGRMETVLPLSAEELERAIVQPAALVDVTFEPGLPARIIQEMLYQPGALPLLQYALTELFEARQGRLLTQQAYDELGGAVGALARRADEIYQGFGEQAREAARQMFLRMVNLGDGSSDAPHAADTRRRVRRAELLALVAEPELMDEVIDTFGAFRMLSLDHEAASRQPTVELAHEALIAEWGRLEGWLVESRDDLRRYRRFQAMAGEWFRSGREPGYLLRQTRLDSFTTWAAGTDLAITPDEQAYLDASIEARTSRQDEEEARRQRELETARELAQSQELRAEEQVRSNRRLRWLAAALAVFLLVAVGAALSAQAANRRAEAQARLAFARELAAESVSNLSADPELSIHLAHHAVRATLEQDGFVLPVAEEALHRAIQASRVNYTVPHSGGVAFSPDGRFLVTGTEDGSAVVWDAATGQRLRSLAGHAAPIAAVAFSPDGSLLATVSNDYQRIVWDFDDGRPVLRLPGSIQSSPDAGLTDLRFSPDGQFLLTTAQFADAGMWDVASGRQLLRFESSGPTAAFSPDGREVALMTAAWDIAGVLQVGTASAGSPAVLTWGDRLFDYADPFIEFVAPSSEIESAFQQPGSVSFSPDGTRLLTTVVSSLAVMRDAGTGAPLYTLTGHTSIINATAFSPDGDRVATAGADGTARVWDAGNGQILLVLEGHRDELIHVAFSPDGLSLATDSLDGTTRMWDISPGGRGEWPGPVGHRGSALVAFAPGASRLVTVGQDGVAHMLDLSSGEPVRSLSGAVRASPPGPDVSAIGWNARPAFSRDGEWTALAGERGVVQLVETATGELLRTFPIGHIVSVIAISSDGDRLFAGGEDGVLSILDMDTGETLAKWIVQDGFVNGLAFSPDGATLAIVGADGDGIVASLDHILPDRRPAPSTNLPGRLPAEAIQATLVGHQDVIVRLELSPDGTRYLTSSWDGTARVWDGDTGEPLLTLSGHQGRLWDAAYSPDGGRIATAGADGRLILWDAESGEQLYVLASRPDDFVSLDFSDDGQFLAAAAVDGSVRVFVMPIDDLVALATGRLTRELSEAECRLYLHLDRCPG